MGQNDLLKSFFYVYFLALGAANVLDALIWIFLIIFTIWWILAIPWRLWIIKSLLQEQLAVMKKLASQQLPKVIEGNQQEVPITKPNSQPISSNKPTIQYPQSSQDIALIYFITVAILMVLIFSGFALVAVISRIVNPN